MVGYSAGIKGINGMPATKVVDTADLRRICAFFAMYNEKAIEGTMGVVDASMDRRKERRERSRTHQ
jgi:hypothetical protein